MKTITDSTQVVHRKAGVCDGCGRVIDLGEWYRRVVAAHNLQAFVWTICTHCDALIALLDRTFVDERAAALLAADVEPFDVTVDRWRALWRRQWRRPDGGLFPIPRSDAA